MAKLDVHWQKGKGKDDDCIVVSKAPARQGSIALGPFAIPARLFHDIARAGVALLRENHYGTFLDEDEISLEIKRAPRPEDAGLFIVGIYANDHPIMQIWCDHISKWGTCVYTFNLKGINIGGIGAKQVTLAEDLIGYEFKPARNHK